MNSEVYELLALFMRYVFLLLGVLIVVRTFFWLYRDHQSYRNEMKSLPDAGLVGEVVDLRTGKSQPLPYEGVLGSSHNCDIRVRDQKVASRHAAFRFEPGKGLRITPRNHCDVWLEDKRVAFHAHAVPGSVLRVGNTRLRIRLFSGLNVPNAQASESYVPLYRNTQIPEVSTFENTDFDSPPSPFSSSSGDFVSPFETAPLSGNPPAPIFPPPEDAASPSEAAPSYDFSPSSFPPAPAYPPASPSAQFPASYPQFAGESPESDEGSDGEEPFLYENPLPQRKRRRRS